MKREDYIGMGLAYLGCFILTHWMIWSYNTYGIWDVTNPIKYITTFGGLMG